jgi:serine/threonine protein kinase/tetratricopeptide (TPR) repeat protein
VSDAFRQQIQLSLGSAYTLERELGGGGMSRVFLAEETRLHRRVVVKLLAPEQALGLSAERFEREISLAAGLQEPHIVAVLTAGTTADGVPYYTMPYVSGASLRQRMESARVPIAEAMTILEDVATALEYAHAEGVVHRDIKPENVLLAGRTAVVTDFGIAKALTAARAIGANAMLTMVGTSVGTPAYMAPEQAAGDPDTDHRADLYAWGMMAYELLAGRHPFAGKATPQAYLVAHFVERPAPLGTSAPDLPAALAAVVMRCVEKEPAARPAGAAELLTAIAASLVDAPGTRPPSVVVRPAERAVAVLPFENLSPDPDNAFFADGLTEEVITDLAHVRALRVIARSSVTQYRASTKSAREVGRALGADYLLSGSVRRSGAALRVTAQLVDVERDAQVWAERFSGTMDDVFELQERLARDIVRALEVRLSPEEDRQLAARSIRSAEAYDLYLRARQSDFLVEAAAIDAALGLLDRADEIEGERAPLLAARALLVWNQFNLRLRGEDAYVEARALADRALSLDPTLAPALFARAMLEFGAERVDAALVLRLLRRAVDAERSPSAIALLAIVLTQVGRPDLAMPYASLMQQLDPFSTLTFCAACFPLAFAGSVSEAIAVATAALRHSPDDQLVRFLLGLGLGVAGRFAEAAEVLAHCSPEGVYAPLAELMRRSLAGDADGVAALAADEELQAAAAHDDQYSWHLAQALAHVGRLDEAMAWLRHGAARTFVNARFVGTVDAMLAPLRPLPEFTALLDVMRQREREIVLAAGV